MKAESVFEKYAHEYDILTNASARVTNHRLEVRALIDRFQPSSVLDAGCASGLTTSLFAEEGIMAVGLDLSTRMISVARAKFSGTKLPVSFETGSFEQLPQTLNGKFDLVVCLANSISGVGTVSNLKRSLAGFRRILTPGGALVLQLLNLSALKEGEVMPVKATRSGDIGYLRFARRRAKRMEVTIVRLDFSIEPFGFEPFVHEMESFSPASLTKEVRAAGFKRISRFGDLQMKHRFEKNTRDFILTAVRP